MIPWKFGRRVVVANVGLSRDASLALLHIPVVDGKPVAGLSTLSPAGTANGTRYWMIPVQIRPLDAIYSGDVAFIKIDVEGHEEDVPHGAHRTIARCRPRVLVEAEERRAPGTVGRVRAFFAMLGCRGYFVLQRRLQPIERFDPAVMQRTEDIAPCASGAPRRHFDHYVNNFLFLPPEEPSATLGQLERALNEPASIIRPPRWPRLGRRS